MKLDYEVKSYLGLSCLLEYANPLLSICPFHPILVQLKDIVKQFSVDTIEGVNYIRVNGN